MRAVEVLRAEHRLIARGLMLCQTLARRLRGGGRIPASDLATLLDFFLVYADGHHQRREEIVVASWLRSHGMTEALGPIACMHQEHRSTRAHLRSLAGHARSPHPDAAAVIEDLEAIVGSLSESIREEECLLFPVLEQLHAHDQELCELFEDCLPQGDRIEYVYQGVIAGLEDKYAGPSPGSCGMTSAHSLTQMV